VTLTLLIDLDDTLLGNSMDTFIPAYLNALGKHLADHTPPEQMAKAMMVATNAMFTNTQPDLTLEAVFDPLFYPPLGLVKSELSDHLEAFYENVFPTLKELTQFLPEAVSFVEQSFERGYQIAIGTNPVFPRTAILQRLTWAGLSPEKYPFAFIPAYEDFHNAKPNPAYFAEFLGRMGWPDGPILMVGNDPDHDVRGAVGMGLPVFWISDGTAEIPEGFPAPTASGTLAEVLPWIDSQPIDNLIPDCSSKTALIAILRGSLSALVGMAEAFPSYLWNECPQPNEWCLTEIICHLRDVEREINLPRLEQITTQDNPFIPGIDSDAWAKERNYKDQDGQAALNDLITARKQTLSLMDNLQEEDWSRPAQHAIFGPTHLQELVDIIARHDQLHDHQVFETINTIKASVDLQ
jgi:FMN phosphatase YigB (HAD superfamily)